MGDKSARPADEPSSRTSPATERLQVLRELVPEAFLDGTVDVARLAEAMGADPAASTERYGLSWAGRTDAVRSLQVASHATLRPDVENSEQFDAAENVFIEGDNLEVLKLLQKAYNDRVRLIYFDPPYNTTSDFVYNDDFTDSLGTYLRYTGQTDSAGRMVSATVESGGRRHSGWLSFMYPRLALARNLLRPDGAIFVSIDDNEVHNLRLLMDEIFGPDNFIAQMVWAAGRKNDSKYVSNSHEYIVVYARSIRNLDEQVGRWRLRKPGLEEIYATFERLKRRHGDDYPAIERELKAWFSDLPPSSPAKRQDHFNRVDARGIYFPDNISWPGGGGPTYEVLHPVTGKPVRVPSRGWMFATPERMQEVIAEDRVQFAADENGVPTLKSYLRDREFEVAYSVFYQDGRGATKRLRTLLGGNYFENPKDETILQSIVAFATGLDDIVMDLFAGSATTAHAVMLQNAADNGKRKFVLGNLPESTPVDSDARAAGLETVAAIARLRIQRAASEVLGAPMPLRCYRLAESSFKLWDSGKAPTDPEGLGEALTLFASSLRDDAADDDISSELLLKEGVALDAAMSRLEIAGQRVVVSGDTAVCLARQSSPELVDALLVLQVKKLVCLDLAFAGRDEDKANLSIGARKAGIEFRAV